VKEHDNKFQEEDDNHTVNESGKDTQNDGQKDMVLILCRSKVQIRSSKWQKQASNKTRGKKKNERAREIFHIGKIREVDSVRLWIPDASWGICDS